MQNSSTACKIPSHINLALGFAVNLSSSDLNMAKIVIYNENLALSLRQFHLTMMLASKRHDLIQGMLNHNPQNLWLYRTRLFVN